MAEPVVVRQYREYTRYLKPLRPTTFTDIEMLQSLVQCLDAEEEEIEDEEAEGEEVASVAQLLGNRRGVIRVTFKTSNGVDRLEQAVQKRRLTIGSVPLGLVDDGGQFIVVTLDNVPNYVPDEQVEQEMTKYGVVAACNKDYVEVHGCRIENERRNVLFTAIFNKQALNNSELDLFGTTVYARTPYLDPETGNSSSSSSTAAALASQLQGNARGTNSAESGRQQQTPAAETSSNPLHQQQQQFGKRNQFGKSSGRGSSSSTAATKPRRASMFPMMTAPSVDLLGSTTESTPGKTSADSVGAPAQQPLTSTTAVGSGRNSSLPPQPTGSSATQGRPAGGSDARQLQKRTEAFEQLSAFLQ